MTPRQDTPHGRPRKLSTHDQPIAPSQARALHDAGVPGVPAFVALTGRPVRSRDLDPMPPAPLPVRLSTSRGRIWDEASGLIVQQGAGQCPGTCPGDPGWCCLDVIA